MTGTTKTVKGTLNSLPGETFDIDFYANASCDSAGNGEGQTYLGSITTSATDANGDVSFTFHPDATHAASMTAGKVITATATSTGAFFRYVGVLRLLHGYGWIGRRGRHSVYVCHLHDR